MKKIGLFLLMIYSLSSFGQQPDPLKANDYKNQEQWVDSIYNKMTLDEKIGQLFMVQVFTNDKGDKNTQNIKTFVSKYHIGGVIFSKGKPDKQAKLTNEIQQMSKIPLFVAMDAECGLAMRLENSYAFPWNMTLGALKNNELVQNVGKRIAAHCKRLGVNIDFAPSVDINTNPNNPIIGNRSFGEDKKAVGEKGVSFMKGMQEERVFACAKHFPGHGDTSVDSHLALPNITFSQERIESTELQPFKDMINSGVATVMVGHLSIPSLEKSGKPSSLSYNIITNILKNKLGFNGLIFTDALGMKGVANYAKAGEVDLQAFLAGNDILLMPEDVVKGIDKIKKAYNKGVINEYRLKYSVKKILKAKYWAGLNKYKAVELNNILKDINTKEDRLLSEQIYEQAITIAKNDKELLPLKKLDKNRTGYIEIGEGNGDVFFQTLNNYDKVDKIEAKDIAGILKEIEKYDRVVIGLLKKSNTPWDSYKMYVGQKDIINKISARKKVVLCLFTSPYTLLELESLKDISSILVAYQNNDIAQSEAAQAVFGAIDVNGILPVSGHKELPAGRSIHTQKIGRLQYGMAESVGMNSDMLQKIDSIVNMCISQKMTPSAQVLVARKGKVIYEKSFGTYTYDSDKKVENSSLYDLASLTKILCTVPELIKMYDSNKISINSTMASLLPELKGSNKEDLTVMNALAHYGKLQAWIPFYKETMRHTETNFEYYSQKENERYHTKVADDMYVINGYKDSIFNKIRNSDLLKRQRYLYSDLSYYLFQRYIEKVKGKSLDVVADEDFYNSMGTNRLTFLPLRHFGKDDIIPSEDDRDFRKQKLQGYVNDQGAALMGGVGGHAGLFGNANDIAKFMQMYLQKGYYGDVRYFSEQAFDVFNKPYFIDKRNRRALGFDKPQPHGEHGPTCGCVSEESFGHSGFTGTYTWADPKSEIIYVFLSNRTYPSANNKKLINSNVRSKIQQVVQDAIIY